MIFRTFDQLLGLDMTCRVAAVQDAALIVIGDLADELAARIRRAGRARVESARMRVLFGLPILTAPFPLFVGGVMTERNAALDQMSAFAWIEDHYIEQPRAEVFGLTPFAEQPVLFLRDFDMDRPVEAWFQTQQPVRWLRAVGVAIATSRAGMESQALTGDSATLAALEHALPADAQPFVEGLCQDVARGQTLRAALRQRRRTADASLIGVCDGWRVLARAARFVRLNPGPGPGETVEDVLRLAPEKRW
jgi:hypothetical protein